MCILLITLKVRIEGHSSKQAMSYQEPGDGLPIIFMSWTPGTNLESYSNLTPEVSVNAS